MCWRPELICGCLSVRDGRRRQRMLVVSWMMEESMYALDRICNTDGWIMTCSDRTDVSPIVAQTTGQRRATSSKKNMAPEVEFEVLALGLGL